ncbi:YdcF family protein [Aneurinibacillus terranovensis]|uniref:YdcF family protein n=1 Tax=Aneurinibacillus terranovensis TaxID=278991 RepID=UPI000401E40F|nr:YdcF family protein [Aneurinibacillus terranovensis]
MMYVVKFLYSFLLPPGIFIVFLLILGGWLFRRDRKAACLSLLFAIVMYVFSTPYVGDMFIQSLEKRYHPPAAMDGDVLVMLGGGATADTPDADGTGQLSGSGANRLLTTVRLFKQTGLPIILSGGQVYSDSGSEALIAKRQLITMGVPEAKILTDNKSLNTAENARYTKLLLQKYHFTRAVLITSAFHMERAVRNFAKDGIRVIPYPTDYKSDIHPGVYTNRFAPSSDALSKVAIAVKEYIGMTALSF